MKLVAFVKKHWIACLVCFIILCALVYGLGTSENNGTATVDNPKTTGSTAVDDEITEFTPDELVTQYQADKDAFKEKYEGKTLRITGRVANVSTSPNGDDRVVLKASDKMETSVYVMINNEKEEITNIKDKDYITATGKFQPGMAFINIKECKIENITPYEETPEYAQDMEAQQQKDEAFAQHQKTVNDMLAGMQESSNGMVLSLELKSDTIFNMKVSNSWYLMKENEKQYFAEEMFKQFNQLAQEWAGRDSVLAIYDESGNEVAITRLSGGMKIKR